MSLNRLDYVYISAPITVGSGAGIDQILCFIPTPIRTCPTDVSGVPPTQMTELRTRGSVVKCEVCYRDTKNAGEA